MTLASEHQTPLFHRLYGASLGHLPPAIRAVHDIGEKVTWHGRASIERGGGLLATLVCRLLGFPPAGRDLALQVTMRRQPTGERWQRKFGQAALDSRLIAGPQPGTVVELLGPLAACSRLDCDNHGVTQTLVGLKLLAIPLPRPLWPLMEVRETAVADAIYGFSMRIAFPWRTLIIHYHGTIDVAAEDREDSE